MPTTEGVVIKQATTYCNAVLPMWLQSDGPLEASVVVVGGRRVGVVAGTVSLSDGQTP